MESILIKNGTLADHRGERRADVLIKGSRIEALGLFETPADALVIDAAGKYVFAGGIDPHVHLSLPTSAGPSGDDFLSGGTAALAGGTTTLIDFVTPGRGQSLVQAFEERIAETVFSPVDFLLHMGITWFGPETEKQMEWCVKEAGIRSFKAYLAYKGTIGIGYHELQKVMATAARLGAVVLVHCEEGDLIIEKQKEFLDQGKTQPLYHALSRPPAVEAESVCKVIELCRITGCTTYIVHTSAAQSLGYIRQAKKEGLPLYCETCPQYLLLDESVYEKPLPESLKYVISPPLRSKADQQAMWQAIADGTVDTLATDHCPLDTFGQKDAGISDFTKIPNGAGGIEYRLALLYSYGVVQGRISLQRFAELVSANSARIFGFYPQKGIIAAGSDADLVVFDPSASSLITTANQYQNCDSNIYEGFVLQGAVRNVVCKGKIRFDNELTGGFENGRFLKTAL